MSHAWVCFHSGPAGEIMSKTYNPDGAAQTGPAPRAAAGSRRPRIALLSNPKSTGNLAQLWRIRSYCADHPDIFHYEVERVEQVGEGLKTIARVRPKMLVINGGDGTVQAALTEMYNGGHFGDTPPPVAVLPSGKTNLIALDLGAHGDPIAALERLVAMAQNDLSEHLVARELIALQTDGTAKPVIGMFLGGAGLAQTMLYCRNKIYPLGLPNGVSHVLTAIAVLLQMIFRIRSKFLPPSAPQLRVSTRAEGQLSGRFAILAVTTLDKLLLKSDVSGGKRGGLKLLAIEERPWSLLRAVFASVMGKLSATKLRGVHMQETDEINIEGDQSSVILDGETFSARVGHPIRLTPAQPLSFVKLAA
jgi:hypothetical protein